MMSGTPWTRDYVSVPNADFGLVCQLAGLEPRAVRDTFRAG